MTQIAERLAQRTGAILLPQNWLGVVGYDEMLGTITFSKEVVKSVIQEFFESLEKIGAKVILFLTGHYGPYQLEMIREATEQYTARSSVRIIAQAEYEGVDFTSLCVGPDHAGKFETSLAMALFPHLVRMDAWKPELQIPTVYPSRENEWDFRSPTGTFFVRPQK